MCLNPCPVLVDHYISQLSEIIDRYIREFDESNARFATYEFFQRSFWDHTLTEKELLSEAIEIGKKAYLLDAQTVSSLCEIISELPDGGTVVEDIISKWISIFRSSNPADTEFSYFSFYNLHSTILSEFETARGKAQIETSVYDACRSVAENNAWGSRQEIAFKSSTVQDMEAIIRNSPISDMRFFMSKMIDFCIHKETYEKYFGSAMDNFMQACRNIIKDPQATRLGKLIKKLFADSELKNLLEENQHIKTDL